MKKTFTLFTFLIILLSTSAKVQAQSKTFHEHKQINMAAVLAASKPSLINSFSSVGEARTIINDIMDVVDQQQNFEVVATTQIDNAAAMFYNGKRYVLYNPSFINQLNNSANDRWAAISVLAHEIGHHLLGHTIDGRGNPHSKELNSDEFSGLVLRRMGASLQQAQLAMSLISSPRASASHPGRDERLYAIAKGWNGTSERVNNNRDVAIDYPTQDRSNYPTERRDYPTQDRNYPNTGRYPQQRQQYPQQRGHVGQYPQQRSGSMQQETLVYRINFIGGSRDQYFITSRNNVVMYSGNRLVSVARIANTNSMNYPYVIYDDRLQLHVDRRGTIYSNGRTVGRITQA